MQFIVNLHYNILLNQEYQTGQAFQIFFLVIYSICTYSEKNQPSNVVFCICGISWKDCVLIIRIYACDIPHTNIMNFPRSNSSIFPLDSSLFPWLLTLYIVFPLRLLLIVWTHWSMEGSLAKLLFEYVTGST